MTKPTGIGAIVKKDAAFSITLKSLDRAKRWSTRAWVMSAGILAILLLLSFPSFRDFVASAHTLLFLRDLSPRGSNSFRSVEQGGLMSDTTKILHAPDFTGAVGWLNVERPLTIQDLRGKVVLLDFWTYCCINCMHIIPDLKKLEAKYGNALAVIGVHSAKFENEKDSGNIREAILRYEIEHPVVNDANFAIWRRWGVRAWPTLALVDPDGYVVGTASGEGNYDTLDTVIGQLIQQFKAKNKIDTKPLPIALERAKRPPTMLSFPGKILADEKSERLFIADSNHNRILVTTLDGKSLDVAGYGTIGKTDGAFSRATFHHPQGLALNEAGDALWVADTENHVIRKLDLKKRTVETVAGTGMQAAGGATGGAALRTALNSPWDLVEVKGRVYIAMAGSHQLWVLDPSKKDVRPFAGSGMEDIADGPLSFSALAQPSGISTDGKRLFFADSEVSAVRFADLGSPNEVHTLIGEGLFEFGDIDGAYPRARLQHPLGVIFHDGKVFVADTYNHKIRRIDPEKKSVETFLGTGKPGIGTETAPQFYEPAGLAIAREKLYIADTNNNAIRVADLKTKKVTTLQLGGVVEMTSPSPVDDDANSPFLLKQSFAPRSVKPGVDAKFLVDLKLPEGYHLNPLAPFNYQIKKVTGEGVTFADGLKRVSLKDPKLPITIPFKTASNHGKSEVELAMTVYYCRIDNQGQCFIKSLELTQPLEVASSAPSSEVPVKVEIQ